MMLREIASSTIILKLRICLLISSVYFWFKKPNWVTAAYLIIAGTGAGLLSVYFFAFYQLSVLGCLGVVIFCYLAHKLWQLVKTIGKRPKLQAFRKIWCGFWSPAKNGVACAIFIAILIERFIPWEFPIFGKPQPYVVTGNSYSVGFPKKPNDYTISIAVDSAVATGRNANVAATCAAAARYLLEQYGFSAITVNMYTYFGEPNKKDECYYHLAQCRYSPRGYFLNESDRHLKPGWNHFKVARDYPKQAILECNRLVAQGLNTIKDYEQIRGEMGYSDYSKLEPDFLEVDYKLLPGGLCEKPSSSKDWMFPISRGKLEEECDSLYQKLKVIGEKQDFPNCYLHGCADRDYIDWARQKYSLWERREGNFAPEIRIYNREIYALAKAFARGDKPMIDVLSAKVEKAIQDLKADVPCGED